MNVNITISDESKFNEVIKKELEAFTKEELHNIVGQALVNYFSDEKHVKELFYTETYDHWGSKRTERAEFFNSLIPSGEDVITNDLLKEVKTKLKEVLTSDEAVKQMILDTWFNNLTESIAYRLTDNGALRGVVSMVVDDIRNGRQ